MPPSLCPKTARRARSICRWPARKLSAAEDFLLVELYPDALGMRGIAAPSGLSAAELVVAQARDPVGRQPIGHRLEQVSMWLSGLLSLRSVVEPLPPSSSAPGIIPAVPARGRV